VIVDEAELGQLATLIARLSPGQQQLVAALADAFRAANRQRTVVVGAGPLLLAAGMGVANQVHHGRPSEYLWRFC
jgi:hypothetical protein